MTLTPEQFLLLDLLMSNALRLAINAVSGMTPEEVQAKIEVEQERKKTLMEGI